MYKSGARLGPAFLRFFGGILLDFSRLLLYNAYHYGAAVRKKKFSKNEKST
jgi:hypothetical protein